MPVMTSESLEKIKLQHLNTHSTVLGAGRKWEANVYNLYANKGSLKQLSLLVQAWLTGELSCLLSKAS